MVTYLILKLGTVVVSYGVIIDQAALAWEANFNRGKLFWPA
jgi:hypothetical protein